MSIRRLGLTLLAFLMFDVLAGAQPPAAVRQVGIKYVRDSEEYAALALHVYRSAGDAVDRARSAASGSWAVVLDIDETTLDNSTYQLERAAYGLPFDAASWAAWVERRQAPAVPGVHAFIDRVRRAGGHVVFITNRDATLTEATRANLAAAGVWNDDDRLCAQKAQYPKAQRRHEVLTGTGECGWPDRPMRIVAFVGDQMADFPGAAEAIPNTGTDAVFGQTCFLLPNPMYGEWTARVTRLK
jgi:5'-nucleotidase (lipoprotein e(P4) family)